MNNNNKQQQIPARVLPTARLTLRQFSGHNSLNTPLISLVFLAMGRGFKRTALKTSKNPIDGLSTEKSTAASGSAGRSTALSGHSYSREVSSTVQKHRYPERESEEDVRRSSHVQASPRCDLSHACLVEVGTMLIGKEEEVPYWYAKGIGATCCIIPRDDINHVIGKGGHNSQPFQELSATLIGVVDW